MLQPMLRAWMRGCSIPFWLLFVFLSAIIYPMVPYTTIWTTMVIFALHSCFGTFISIEMPPTIFLPVWLRQGSVSGNILKIILDLPCQRIYHWQLPRLCVYFSPVPCRIVGHQLSESFIIFWNIFPMKWGCSCMNNVYVLPNLRGPGRIGLHVYSCVNVECLVPLLYTVYFSGRSSGRGHKSLPIPLIQLQWSLLGFTHITS